MANDNSIIDISFQPKDYRHNGRSTKHPFGTSIRWHDHSMIIPFDKILFILWHSTKRRFDDTTIRWLFHSTKYYWYYDIQQNVDSMVRPFDDTSIWQKDKKVADITPIRQNVDSMTWSFDDTSIQMDVLSNEHYAYNLLLNGYM